VAVTLRPETFNPPAVALEDATSEKVLKQLRSFWNG
jgi:hypothetical protein